MYNVYLGDILCPVAPEKITVNFANKCSVVSLADGGEINIPGGAALHEINFSLLLPNSKYPFAVYKSGFKPAAFFLQKLKQMLDEKTPFQFIVVRRTEGGSVLGYSNIKCLLESFQVCEDAGCGYDVVVKIKLREYRNFAVKKLDINSVRSMIKTDRGCDNSPAPKSKNITYRVVKGDCMWMIAQRFYGNGNLYLKIYEANRAVLAGRSPRCLIFVGDLLEIPPLN